MAQGSKQRQSNAAGDGAGDQAQRAERLMEDLGGRVGSFGSRAGSFGSRAGSFLASAAARAREEAEDIWAEAQSIRRGQRG